MGIPTITMSNWPDSKITIKTPLGGDYSLSTLIPIEFQLKPMAAEIECPNCDLINDCRKCDLFEYSLLYQILESSGELEI